ncbi:MAG: lipoyl(octanoyl) transferase LipB [Bryobacteraceae bacterium]
MAAIRHDAETLSPAMETFLLGQIDLRRCLELQQRLLRQIGRRDDGQIALLLCEHPAVIAVGRSGSPAAVASESRLVRSGQIEVQWVNRGGGCLLHCPGQLAVYPIVPLRWHGFSVGEYLQRLQGGILAALAELGVRGRTVAGRWGVWGRSGQLAALGVAVRDWVTWHGAYLNVCPASGLFRLVRSDSPHGTRMGSLVAERHGSVRMTAVRATLVRRLAEAFGCDRYHLYTGHPWLPAPRAADGGPRA